MRDYVIYADSACDIPAALLRKWGVRQVGMTLKLDGESRAYGNNELVGVDLFRLVRTGVSVETRAVTRERFSAIFGAELAHGRDVLYLCSSSALGETFENARTAASELERSTSDGRVIVVDTLMASGGCGLLVYLTVKQKRRGATLDQAAQYAIDKQEDISNWFIVDNAAYLERSGDIPVNSGIRGGLAGVRPVFHIDSGGRLAGGRGVRGRRAAVATLADKYSELAENASGGTVIITYSDRIEDANRLAAELKSRHGVKNVHIMPVGAVTGAHAGPGALGLSFVSRDRRVS